MNASTRDRLLEAASTLFAEGGYAGASVRDICNLARANPGAVSYHFGGKRQLYRSVLRSAVARLARVETTTDDPPQDQPIDVLEVVVRLFRTLEGDPVSVRLLLRDLADGGTLAVEALEPRLRAAVEGLQTRYGSTDSLRASVGTSLLFLQLTAPVFLVAVAWPAVARPLGFGDHQREKVLTELIRRILVGRVEPAPLPAAAPPGVETPPLDPTGRP